jgi:hypothetical protein
MNYFVTWAPDALNALAAIWIRAPDRRAVTAAQARIDHLLASDPLANGTHVSEGLYAINVPPLRAQFEIPDGGQLVRVVSVRELP